MKDLLNSTAVVIPYYHGDRFIVDCVRSVLQDGIAAHRIYVVENSVRRGSLQPMQVAYPEVRVLEAPPRLGFGKACNWGARIAMQEGAQTLCILNQDLVVRSGCLRDLVEQLYREEDIALGAPLNYTHDFAEMESFYVRHFLSEAPDLVKDAVQGCLKPAYPVEKIMGSCFAIKASLVHELGLFDEVYFMYFEDEDLCRRYVSAGCKLILTTRFGVGHAHSHTHAGADASIDLMERESEEIFDMKRADRSFLSNWLRVQRRNVVDYLRFLTAGRLGVTASAIWSDLRLWGRVAGIARSRREECQKIQQFRQSRLERDRALGSRSSAA